MQKKLNEVNIMERVPYCSSGFLLKVHSWKSRLLKGWVSGPPKLAWVNNQSSSFKKIKAPQTFEPPTLLEGK